MSLDGLTTCRSSASSSALTRARETRRGSHQAGDVGARWIMVLTLLVVASLQSTAHGQEPTFHRYVPRPNDDGSHFIWAYLNLDRWARPYVPTIEIPASRHYREVEEVEAWDIVWWPNFAAIAVEIEEGKMSLVWWPEPIDISAAIDSLGTPRYFRPVDTDGDSLGVGPVSLTAFGKTAACTNPNPSKWLLEVYEVQEERGTAVTWLKHWGIEDPHGQVIQPVAALSATKFSDSIPTVLEFLDQTVQKTGLILDQWMLEEDLHLCYAHSPGPITHRMIIGIRIVDSVGYRVMCDSTDGVYEDVKEEMERFIHSFRILPEKPD